MGILPTRTWSYATGYESKCGTRLHRLKEDGRLRAPNKKPSQDHDLCRQMLRYITVYGDHGVSRCKYIIRKVVQNYKQEHMCTNKDRAGSGFCHRNMPSAHKRAQKAEQRWFFSSDEFHTDVAIVRCKPLYNIVHLFMQLCILLLAWVTMGSQLSLNPSIWDRQSDWGKETWPRRLCTGLHDWQALHLWKVVEDPFSEKLQCFPASCA